MSNEQVTNKCQLKRIIAFSFVLFYLLIANCSLLYAMDFGLILDQNADYGGYGSDSSFGYSGSLLPRVSGLIGDNADLYISAGINASYSEAVFDYGFELLRTELSMESGKLGFKAGRMHNSDPLGFVAEGLFDGAKLSFETDAGSFSIGAWYTGLLYKKRALIAMTAHDWKTYDDPDNYFASKRFVSSLGWEHLSLGNGIQARFAILGQFDLADEEKFDSQYLIGKFSFPGAVFSFDAGGCLELIEYDDKLSRAYAAEARFSLMPPTQLPQRISLLGRYASGSEAGAVFEPLTIKTQGEIFKAKLSGISLLALDYFAQMNGTFAVGLGSTYFIQNDFTTHKGYPLASENNDGAYFMGNEFFGRLLWTPASDVQINLGGGVFMPSMGNAAPKADMSWRIDLNVVIGLY